MRVMRKDLITCPGLLLPERHALARWYQRLNLILCVCAVIHVTVHKGYSVTVLLHSQLLRDNTVTSHKHFLTLQVKLMLRQQDEKDTYKKTV